MIVKYKRVTSDGVFDHVLDNIDYIDVGSNGLHAFRKREADELRFWNYFIPFNDLTSVRIEP